MKKLLIALLALGALSFVPEAEARYNRKGGNCKKECKKEKPCASKKTFKQSCAPQCSETTKLDHTKWIPCMVPGKRRVDCYKTVRTCVDTSECCEDVPGAEECLAPGEELE